MALLLRRRGIQRVRPLAGGLDAWRQHGYVLEPISPQSAPAAETSPGAN